MDYVQVGGFGEGGNAFELSYLKAQEFNLQPSAAWAHARAVAPDNRKDADEGKPGTSTSRSRSPVPMASLSSSLLADQAWAPINENDNRNKNKTGACC